MNLELKRDAINEETGWLDLRGMDRQAEGIKALVNGIDLSSDEGDEVVRAIMAFQREDGSFSLVSDYAIPSDARVFYIYRPSYACCQVLMSALFAGSKIEGLEESLSRGLKFACGRKLVGHGFDGLKQQMEDMSDFAAAGASKLLSEHRDLCPEFSDLIEGILKDYMHRIEVGEARGDYREDFTMEMTNLLESYGMSPQLTVFVYGTLLSGGRASELLEGSPFLGKAELSGYCLYDLGSFPGIKKCEFGSGVVLGEARLCDSRTLRLLNGYESEGILYDLAPVTVRVGGVKRCAYAYVYRGDVDYMSEIPLQLQPYTRLENLKRTHVWYACYGSNMLYERFMSYIAGGLCRFNGRRYPGCTDKTPPVDVETIAIPYNVYFGNSSGSWDGCGAAFLDLSRSGEAQGRAYLITKEQYQELRMLEGSGASWYCDEVSVGRMSGIEVKTFSNRSPRPKNEPSAAYLKVMELGLAEGCDMDSQEIAQYLDSCLSRCAE